MDIELRVFACTCGQKWKKGELPSWFTEQPTTDLDFGPALAAMRDGKVVQRSTSVTPPYRVCDMEIQFRIGKSWIPVKQMAVSSILATDWRVVPEEEL